MSRRPADDPAREAIAILREAWREAGSNDRLRSLLSVVASAPGAKPRPRPWSGIAAIGGGEFALWCGGRIVQRGSLDECRAAQRRLMD